MSLTSLKGHFTFTVAKSTPPKTNMSNMEPTNKGLENVFSLQRCDFQVNHLSFQGCMIFIQIYGYATPMPPKCQEKNGSGHLHLKCFCFFLGGL